MTIKNLDKLIPEKKKFILGGKEFVVPPISLKHGIMLREASQNINENHQEFIEILNIMWEILSTENSNIKHEKNDFVDKLIIEMIPDLIELFMPSQSKDSEQQGGESKNASGVQTGQ